MRLNKNFTDEKHMFLIVEKESDGRLFIHENDLTEKEAEDMLPSLLRECPDGVFYILGPYSSHIINIKESIVSRTWS